MSADSRGNLYSEYIDAIYGTSNSFSGAQYGKIALEYDVNYGSYLPEDRCARILDVGCGAGHFLYFLQKKGFENFEGIDVSPQQVDFCHQHVSRKVSQADAFDYLKDRAGCYDLLAANDLLEHIPKDRVLDFLRLIRSALRARGHFLLKTPNMANPYSLCSRYRDFTHEVGFTETSLYQVLYMAGFRQISILSAKNIDPDTPKARINRFIQKAIFCYLNRAMKIQGFHDSNILTLNLIGIAVNEGKQ
jgi:2-polyprenyl-3-methyl-5-hydroxy-6-metoxy-1,4-benzoquinol methylase